MNARCVSCRCLVRHDSNDGPVCSALCDECIVVLALVRMKAASATGYLDDLKP